MIQKIRRSKKRVQTTSQNIMKDITNVDMANEMRERSSSFDLHDIHKGHAEEVVDGDQPQPHHHPHKPNFLAKLIRSISENSMRKKSPSASPATSPKNSPKASAARRRRFVRVIKNDEQVGEEYINPHVVRKYEQGFWENNFIRKSASLDEPQRPLPYTVSGNTILKKAHSIDCSDPGSPSGTPPLSAKSCKFNESVEVIEYDIKGKCLMIMNDAHVSHEKLHEDNLQCLDDGVLVQIPRGDQCPLRVAVEANDISEANYKLEALEVIDENKALRPDDEEHLLDDIQIEDIKDNVFESDCSETDSATESCDDCGCEKKSDSDSSSSKKPQDSDSESTTESHLNGLEAAECSEDDDSSTSMRCSPPAHAPRPPTPPTTRRQSSDEGISAPKKTKFTAQSAAETTVTAALVTAEH